MSKRPFHVDDRVYLLYGDHGAIGRAYGYVVEVWSFGSIVDVRLDADTHHFSFHASDLFHDDEEPDGKEPRHVLC